MLSGEGEQKREEEWARRVLKRLDLKMRAGQTQAVTNDMTPSKHTYILYCIAPPWGLLRHTEIKKIKDKNIYNKETKMKKKIRKRGYSCKSRGKATNKSSFDWQRDRSPFRRSVVMDIVMSTEVNRVPMKIMVWDGAQSLSGNYTEWRINASYSCDTDKWMKDDTKA